MWHWHAAVSTHLCTGTRTGDRRSSWRFYLTNDEGGSLRQTLGVFGFVTLEIHCRDRSVMQMTDDATQPDRIVDAKDTWVELSLKILFQIWIVWFARVKCFIQSISIGGRIQRIIVRVGGVSFWQNLLTPSIGGCYGHGYNVAVARLLDGRRKEWKQCGWSGRTWFRRVLAPGVALIVSGRMQVIHMFCRPSLKTASGWWT